MFCVFASQPPGLCGAIPSAPIKFFCTLVFNFALFSNFLFCILCLTNIGFVPCFSFGSRKVSYTLSLRFSQNFVLRVLPHKNRVCAVLLPRLPSSLHPFAFLSLFVCLLFFFFSLLLLCVLCPTSSGVCSDFSPAPLEFARFTFALYYSVLSLCSAFFPALI